MGNVAHDSPACRRNKTVHVTNNNWAKKLMAYNQHYSLSVVIFRKIVLLLLTRLASIATCVDTELSLQAERVVKSFRASLTKICRELLLCLKLRASHSACKNN